jgi:pyrimidine operon attenuation protein/uracil phosphoribosyltransferase
MNKGVSNLLLVGIARGGIPVANKLAKNIFDIEKEKPIIIR